MYVYIVARAYIYTQWMIRMEVLTVSGRKTANGILGYDKCEKLFFVCHQSTCMYDAPTAAAAYMSQARRGTY